LSEANEAKPKEHLLALKGVTQSFGPVQALTDVDFEVNAGEVVALVGDNGAGKSTLVKAIDGVQPADSGEMYFEGRKVRVADPKAAAKLGIATVFQDLALCDNLDVVANLFLGREELSPPPGRYISILNESEMESTAGRLLESLSVSIPSVRTRVASLSGGQRQSVAIARSLLGEPKVVLLDEPTAALGVAQTRQVLDLIGRLRERGLAVVVISHNLVDVFEVADRIFVLRLGRAAGDFRRDDTSQQEIVAAITGGLSEQLAGGPTEDQP
jgi:D-xylose transport system ATP-binding protein